MLEIILKKASSLCISEPNILYIALSMHAYIYHYINVLLVQPIYIYIYLVS